MVACQSNGGCASLVQEEQKIQKVSTHFTMGDYFSLTLNINIATYCALLLTVFVDWCDM